MAQPTTQRPADSGHDLAGFFAYAYDDGAGGGLWDATNGAMLTKVGSAAVATEGGATVVTSASDTYYTLASALSLPGAFSLGFRCRVTAADNRSMPLGQHTTTASYIWLNTSSNAKFNTTTIGANGGVTTMATWYLVRDGDFLPIVLYKDGVPQATLSNSQGNNLEISAILKGYSSSTSFDFHGALEWVHVLPAGRVLTLAEVSSLTADPYQLLGADISAAAAGAAGVLYEGTGAVVAEIMPDASVTASVAGTSGVLYEGTGAVVATVATGVIAITAPLARSMRQRSLISNDASFTVTGTYTGTPGSIEYRWAGGAWGTLVASPSGGTYSQAVTLSTGQGTLEVRFSADPATYASVALITVGDIFLTAGQSNHVGAATGIVSPVVTNFQALEYISGAWVDLRESLTDALSYSGASGYGGSYFGALSNRLQADGVPVGFVPAAAGSTQISQWQSGGGNYTNLVAKNTAVGGARAVLWWLGESDANNGTTQATFTASSTTFFADLFTDTTLEVFLIKIVRWISAADTIRASQDNLIATDPHVIGSADADVYAPSGVHYLTTTDINNVADRVYAGMVTAFYGSDLDAAVDATAGVLYSGTGSVGVSNATGVLTTSPVVNASNVVQADVTIPKVSILRVSDMSLLVNFTNQTTNGAGVLSVTHASLLPGTLCLVVTCNSDGTAFGCQPYTVA